MRCRHALLCRGVQTRVVGSPDQRGRGVLKASRDYLEQAPGELVPEIWIGRAEIAHGLRVELERPDLGGAYRPERPLVRREQPGPAQEPADADLADDCRA